MLRANSTRETKVSEKHRADSRFGSNCPWFTQLCGWLTPASPKTDRCTQWWHWQGLISEGEERHLSSKAVFWLWSTSPQSQGRTGESSAHPQIFGETFSPCTLPLEVCSALVRGIPSHWEVPASPCDCSEAPGGYTHNSGFPTGSQMLQSQKFHTESSTWFVRGICSLHTFLT